MCVVIMRCGALRVEEKPRSEATLSQVHCLSLGDVQTKRCVCCPLEHESWLKKKNENNIYAV